jgi:hypothetical protein
LHEVRPINEHRSTIPVRAKNVVGVKSLDIAAAANERIWDFVHQRPNRRLRAGTGHYSTPFRGGLFGEVMALDVARQLSRRRVDVFWLGANPCVRRSLDNIITPPKRGGDFPVFERQMQSGFFGSCKWDANDLPQPDFNPIERPTTSWKVYRRVFEQIGRLDSVVMANFIPWGSQDMREFIGRLGAVNRLLLQRVIEFADALNAEIIQTVAPRFVVVPFSVGRSRKLNGVGRVALSIEHAIDIRPHALRLPKQPSISTRRSVSAGHYPCARPSSRIRPH